MKNQFADRCLMSRKNTDCSKWDFVEEKFGDDKLLPVWVADMDFKVPECVQKALHEYVEMGAFGYYKTPDDYKDNFIKWEKTHHGYDVKREWILYSPGVVSGIFWLLNSLTEPGDHVIILSPVYYPFMEAITANGRKPVYSMLKNDKGVYTIDFEDFEKKIVDNDVKLFILCSPHNPIGRIWDRDELEKLLSICRKHNVYVISDEIHHDFEISKKHIPAATIGEYDDMLATITAPSKTFNLAAAQNSFVIIPNEEMRNKFKEFVSHTRIHGGNAFGIIAATAAYKGGEKWLEAVLEEIRGNYKFLRDNLIEDFPEIVVSPLEGTYLAWVDFGAYIKHDELVSFIQEECHFAPDYGEWFFPPEMPGDTHVRINLATPGENIEKLVTMTEKALKKRLKNNN